MKLLTKLCFTPLLAVMLMLPLISQAQQDGKMLRPTEWTVLTEQGGVQINYKFQTCNLERSIQQEWVLLQFNNTTPGAKKVAWDLHLWYDQDCKTCDNTTGEYHKELVLQAGETLEGECSIYADQKLRIVSRLLGINHRSMLTFFQLANLRISPTK
jgi:hypothetical protein